MSRRLLATGLLLLMCCPAVFLDSAFAAPRQSARGPLITLSVDAAEASRQLFHVRMTMPVDGGKPLTLYYPKWIPGEHSPTGPIKQIVGFRIEAAGKPLAWRRDPVEMFAIHCDVPAGVASIDVAFDYISPSDSNSEYAANSSDKAAMLIWSTVLFYPEGFTVKDIAFKAQVKIPAGWDFGTALPVERRTGDEIVFQTVPFWTLEDSPIVMGRYFKTFELTGAGAEAPVSLHVAADSPEALAMPEALNAGLKKLVVEANALFGAHHYRSYHFLLALSDRISHYGLEHHESSDNRVEERSFVDDPERKDFVGLLPHEYVHSWNGKYRRPEGLATEDFHAPMRAGMLWVYEGLTQYLGSVLTVRSGLQTPEEFREDLASVAATLDNRFGRTWRPLQDTATAASITYSSPGQWRNYRRGVDFYDEGTLIWLEVDTIIRQKSNGAKSIEDFVRAFHGAPSGAPAVKPYTYDELLSTLNSVVAYDWRTFFDTRLNTTGPRAPLGGIENGGWRLVYTETPNATDANTERVDKIVKLEFSIGLTVADDGVVSDVMVGFPGEKAGLSPGMKIAAVNGRTYSTDRLREAVALAKTSQNPIELIVVNGDFFHVVQIDYHGGLRYPHLERDASKADLVEAIARPLGGAK